MRKHRDTGGECKNFQPMKENRHKAEDVLTRPWPGRQKEREDSERGKERGRRGRGDAHKHKEGGGERDGRV